MEATGKVEEYVFHQNSHFPLSSRMIERIQGFKNKISCDFQIAILLMGNAPILIQGLKKRR